MKKTLLAGAAFATLFATQAYAADALKPYAPLKPIAAASDPVSGYVELYGMRADTAYTSWDTYDPFVGGGGAGRVNWWLSPTTSLQVDAQGFGFTNTGSSDPWYYNGWEVAGIAHLSHRNDSHLIGAFVGSSLTNDADLFYGQTNFTAGGEGQIYIGNITLYGVVGYFEELRSYEGYGLTSLFGNVEARFFLTPNTKLAVNVGFANARSPGLFGGGTTYNLVNYGAEIEHKFGMSPISAFARWDGYNWEGYNDNIVKAGVRFAINQPDLLTQDRKGATLKIDLLPNNWIKGLDY